MDRSTAATGVPVAPVVYRVEEAAQALRVSRDTMYELIRSGRLRTIKVGSRRLVPVLALDEFVAAALAGAG
ncbi:helix-turn-helix domain-containing protein [uncultured Cellulomonas sp.]|uniref:helix-turn-helix domain-containing protein n=1 Tax=uncultured Cellulomonas sp. TaxID=189682 RepID=UPI00262C0529|nr:helix-turn-helix domain-containing protein [uncultured Cellulomonas sp.]